MGIRKLLIFITILLICFNTYVYANDEEVIARKNAVSLDWSDITIFLTYEGTWSAPNYTMSGDERGTDTSGSADNNFDIDAVTFKVGAKSGEITTGTDSLDFNPTSDFASAEGGMGQWVRIGTWDDGAKIFDVNYDGLNNLFVEMSGATNFNFRFEDGTNGNSNLTTIDAGGTTGVWYFIAAYWRVSENKMRLVISQNTRGDIHDSEETDDTMSAWDAEPTGADDLRWGHSDAGTGVYNIDNSIMTSSYDTNIFSFRNETSAP